MRPPRAPAVAVMAVATAVFGLLAAVQITIDGGWPTALVTVLIGRWGAVLVVGVLACGGLALVFTAEYVHRRRARQPAGDDEAVARAVGVLDDDSGWDW